LYGLVPRPKGLAGWPLAATSSAATYSFTRPETICETRINLALIYLEEGNLASAQREFEQALAAHPETGNRNLILYYLSELRGGTGDEEAPFPPSQTIPGEFASEEEFSNREQLLDEFLN
jgi:tetratricopeptide (TPR) repeat protein